MMLAAAWPLYSGLGIIYLVLLVVLGTMCLRKGHWVMFILGFFTLIFWFIGAMIPPRDRMR
ncbi:MAG: hypothetical protein U0V73_10555 [Acidimicrobiia bacterium]